MKYIYRNKQQKQKQPINELCTMYMYVHMLLYISVIGMIFNSCWTSHAEEEEEQ